MARHVIGHTAKRNKPLSDEGIFYKKARAKTVRYRYEKVIGGCLCVVVGPFHSALYGTCEFGANRTSAKKALIRRLANEYGYLGNFMFSDVDESDTVGKVNYRAVVESEKNRRLTRGVLVGTAGQ